MSEDFHPSSSAVIDREDLDTEILGVISDREIHRIIRIAVEHFGRLEEYFYLDVLKSLYFEQITQGTIGDLVGFLRSFRNKSACGFAHETRRRVNGITLTPENCIYKEEYTGCGHPELNGMLIAVALGEALLERAYPSTKGVMRVDNPIYATSKGQDDTVGRIYTDPRLKKNPDGSIAIIPEVRTLQEIAGAFAEERCHSLADSLLEVYISEK